MSHQRTAVIVPCYNEEITVGKVVTDFRAMLPGAVIYVIDNNSTDRTVEMALRAGATVLREKRQGKGEVLKTVCSEIDAEYFILVDGDDTYPAEEAVQLLAPLMRDEADMVVGSRRSVYDGTAPPPFHRGGNDIVCFLVNRIFGARLTDVMSGYRAFTWHVARSLPLISIGFDVETEMTIQLLYRGYVLKEVPIGYRKRPPASVSKLRTVSDGFRVLLKILVLLVAYKPLTVFGSFSLATGLIGGVLIGYGLLRYATSADILPWTAVLGATALVAAILSLSLGLTISSVNWRVRELESHLIKLLVRPLSGNVPFGLARRVISKEHLLEDGSQSAAADQGEED